MKVNKPRMVTPPPAISTTRSKSRRILFLAIPPIEEIDLFGPVSAFLGANRSSHATNDTYHVDIVSGTTGNEFAGHSGIGLLASTHYSAASGAIDTLVVVSGRDTEAVLAPELLRWLHSAAKKTRRTVSICTGAFALAEAGILNHRRATTHWSWAKTLARRYPLVDVRADAIWTRDDNIYTSAGVTAGIDLALALIEDDLGPAVALDVARGMVVFLRRPGGQAQFSVMLEGKQPTSPTIRELKIWMLENLDKDLSVERLAEQAVMSPRHFARIFKDDTGFPPAKYVQNLRLEQARRMLEGNATSIARIASLCGYGDAQLLRRAFQRELGVTPGEYKQRFQTNSFVSGSVP
jgi:transcriptional regulator GlxA family with amidase domain